MREPLDDLFAAVSADVASRTRAPGAERAIAASRRRAVGITAVAATALVVGVVSLTTVGDNSPDPAPAPSPSPTAGLDVGDVPVWYDEAGLHRGEAVEQTAVPLRADGEPGAVLTLVRTGALYLEPVDGSVWFHPWGGEPRVVGHGSAYGPAGDPEGDNAAWFEGDEIVVYDTAEGRETARVPAPPVRSHAGQEHVNGGNGFLQVSSDAVVWLSDAEPQTVLRLDLRTQEVTETSAGTILSSDPSLGDVHGDTQVWWAGLADIGGRVIIRRAGSEQEYPTLEPTGRISPDGRFFLGVTFVGGRGALDIHGSAVVDLRSGQSFRLPDRDESFYPWISWSYGSTAVVVIDADSGSPSADELLACYAEQRECAELPLTGDVVLPS